LDKIEINNAMRQTNYRQKMIAKRLALYSEVYETVEDLQRDLDRDAVELPPPPPPLPPPVTAAATAALPTTPAAAPAATAAAGKDSKVPSAASPEPPPAPPIKSIKTPPQYSSSTRNTRQSDIWGNPVVPDFFVVCSVCGQKVNGPRFTTHLVSFFWQSQWMDTWLYLLVIVVAR
jgi:hypothetical protein